jgi:DNA-binding transcriptional LysR family regulator
MLRRLEIIIPVNGRLPAVGEPVQIVPDGTEERFPLYAGHPCRCRPPAKVQAFLDFVVSRMARPAKLITRDGALSCPGGQDG